MSDFKSKLIRFMSGRYGVDQLNKFLFALIVVCFILNIFGVRFASKISLVLVILYFYRAFSKNYNKRYAENQTYLKLSENFRWKWNSLKKDMEYKKTHRIFKCTKCGKKLSVPKGKGKIEISCPCGNKFQKKS